MEKTWEAIKSFEVVHRKEASVLDTSGAGGRLLNTFPFFTPPLLDSYLFAYTAFQMSPISHQRSITTQHLSQPPLNGTESASFVE